MFFADLQCCSSHNEEFSSSVSLVSLLKDDDDADDPNELFGCIVGLEKHMEYNARFNTDITLLILFVHEFCGQDRPTNSTSRFNFLQRSTSATCTLVKVLLCSGPPVSSIPIVWFGFIYR
jgi:hypothetical protein